MLRYLEAFDDFNPLEDKPDSALFWKIGYLLQRGLGFLPKEFGGDELDAGLEILFELKRVSPIDYSQWENFLTDLGVQDTNEGFHSTEPFLNFLRSEFVEQPQRPTGEPFLWSTVFAIGSLACISDYAWVHKTAFHYTPPEATVNSNSSFVSVMPRDEGAYNNEHKDELLVDATEYLGFARIYSEREASRETTKVRGKAISRAKLTHYHELKFKIVSVYNDLESQISNRKAAKLIYEGLPQELKLKFGTDDPQKQIEKWIGQYRNNKLPGQERLPPCKH